MVMRFFRKGGWVVLILLAFGVGFGWPAWSQRSTAAALDDHGVAALATVEGLRTETHWRRTKSGATSDTEYRVTYAYQAPPEPGATPVRLETEHLVPRFIYDELSLGEEVQIRYLPEDPERAEFFSGEKRRDSNYMAFGAAFFLLIAIVVAPIPGYMAWREHRVVTRGVLAEGTLEESRRWNEQWRVAVRFRDARGVERRATAYVEDRAKWSAMPLGSLVALRYDPADPSNIAMT
jgi:hypothetical protein